MRSILFRLLIAGTAFLGSEAVAYSKLYQDSVVSLNSTIERKNICNTLTKIDNCSTSTVRRSMNLNSDIGVQHIADILLSKWTINGCRKPASAVRQNSVCLSSWQKLIPLNYHNQLIAKANIDSYPKHTKAKPLTTTSHQFPKLSRSSLIVTSPRNNSSLCSSISNQTNSCLTSTDTITLTNPAPETTRIASPFGWRKRPYSGQLQFHQGIDYGAPLGSPVVAAANGIVTQVISGCADFGNRFCGSQYGNWIEIDHGNGAIALYGHLLNQSISVKEGMKVRKNQEIAKVGSSGWSTGAHLDFRLKITGKYQNPDDYIQSNLP